MARARDRTDAARRVRQCERFARLIRITRLLLGHGRWGPEALAQEIDCSVRTVYRDITTLTMAGIPIHFDKATQAYRVPEGFRFPGFSPAGVATEARSLGTDEMRTLARSLLRSGEQWLEQVRALCRLVDQAHHG